MKETLHRKDLVLAKEFATLYSYAQRANQADDANPIRLTKDWKKDSDIIAVRLGFASYRDMPSDTKSFISHCASVKKKQLKEKQEGKRAYLQDFEFIVRDELELLEKQNRVTD